MTAIVVMLLMVFTLNFKDKVLVFCLGVALLAISGAYIVFDLLVIIIPGVVDKDDYILAALQLYIDVARLFFRILSLLGRRKK